MSQRERLFSYSSLEMAKACPARLQLSDREYPTIWSRAGFPSRVTYAAVRGLVIHRCMELLVKVAAGMPANGDQRVAAVRAVGGYSQLIEDSCRDVLADIEVNPRARVLVATWRRRLAEDEETIKHQVQSTLRQVVIQVGEVATNKTSESELRRINNGVFAEFYLRSEDVPLHGWADLLTCGDPVDRVIDFKTGQPSDSHENQLRLYAALWLQDERNTRRRPVAMAAIYGETEQQFGQMNESNASSVIDEWRGRIQEAQGILNGATATASPGRDLCNMCSVKVVCDPYWIGLVSNETVSSLEFVDVEVTLIDQLGTRTWQIALANAPRGLMTDIVHTDLPIDGLMVGDTVRILGALLRSGDDEIEPALRVGRNAEIFVIRDNQPFLAGI